MSSKKSRRLQTLFCLLLSGLFAALSSPVLASTATRSATGPEAHGRLLGQVMTLSGEALGDVEVEAIAFRGIAAVVLRRLFSKQTTDTSWKGRVSPGLIFLGAKPEPSAPHTTRTDAAGHFTLPDLPTGTYRVIAHPEGLPVAWALARISNAHLKVEVEVVATPPLTLHGRTFQSDGQVAPKIHLELITIEGKQAPLTSGPDGRFEIHDLPRGPVDILPRHEGLEPLIQHLDPQGSSRASPARMLLRKLRALSGQVLWNGRGLAGALIEAGQPEEIRSQARGHFTLKNFSGTRLRATTRTASSMRLDPARPQDLPSPLRLELLPHGRAAVAVFDSNGAPVPEVPVELGFFGQRNPAKAMSNRDGVAFFSNLQPERYRATVGEGIYRSARSGERFEVISGALSRARLKVYPTAPLVVRAVDPQGQLLEAARAQVRLHSSEGTFIEHLEGGVARYDAAPAGEASVQLRLEGGSKTQPRAIVVGEASTVSITTMPDPSAEAAPTSSPDPTRRPLQGTLRSADGLPLSGVLLMLRAVPGANPSSQQTTPFRSQSIFGHGRSPFLQARSDPRAAFVFEGVPPGRFELQVQAKAWTLPERTFVEAPSDPLPLELVRAATVSGELLDAQGRPVRPTPVKARDAEAQLLAETRSDAWGFFTLSGLPPGPITLEAEGHDRTVKKALDLPLEGARITLRYPDASATLLLRVQIGQKPVPTFSVSLGLTRARGLRGRLRLEDLDPGSYKLEITVPGHDRLRVPVLLQPGKALRKTVTLPPHLTMQVTVVDPKGRPLPGVEVSLARHSGRRRRSSDAFGEVSFPGLQPGQITLELRDSKRQRTRAILPLSDKTQDFTVTLPGGGVQPGRRVGPLALPRFILVKLGPRVVQDADVTVGVNTARPQTGKSDTRGRVQLASASPQSVKIRVCGKTAPVKIRRPAKKDGSTAWLLLDLPGKTRAALRAGRCRATLLAP